MAFTPVPVDDEQDEPVVQGDPIAMIIAEQLRDQIWMGAATDRRSLQPTVGPSELGEACDRRLAYRSQGIPTRNRPDPLATIIGTGMHSALEGIFKRIDGGSGRFVIEKRVSYRGIFGTCDLYDSRRKAVIDWKSSTKRKIADIRRKGIDARYQTQMHIYGCGLIDQGYPVDVVCLCFIPKDGQLSDLYVHAEPVSAKIADDAIERYHQIARKAEAEGPEALTPAPSRLCPWCPYYVPGSQDLAQGCPGETKEGK